MKKYILSLLALILSLRASAQSASETIGWTEEDEIEVSDINHSGMFVNIGGGLGVCEKTGWGLAGDLGYRYHIKNGWHVEAAISFLGAYGDYSWYSGTFIPITAGFRYNTDEMLGDKTLYVGLRVGYGITADGDNESGFAFSFSPGINLSRLISIGLFVDGVVWGDAAIVAGPRVSINF